MVGAVFGDNKWDLRVNAALSVGADLNRRKDTRREDGRISRPATTFAQTPADDIQTRLVWYRDLERGVRQRRTARRHRQLHAPIRVLAATRNSGRVIRPGGIKRACPLLHRRIDSHTLTSGRLGPGAHRSWRAGTAGERGRNKRGSKGMTEYHVGATPKLGIMPLDIVRRLLTVYTYPASPMSNHPPVA
jgi:hypothetical protein